MGKEKQTIAIDGIEYTEDQLSDEQKILFNVIMDLDRKIGSAQFNLAQLTVGKDAFMGMLKESLEATQATEE
jgi:hypothetical protein